MIFKDILRLMSKRTLVLTAGLLCLSGAGVLANLGMAPWSWAKSTGAESTNNVIEPANATDGSDAYFQTLAEFVNRSPGERGEVNALKGIAQSALAPRGEKPAPVEPTQRALGKIFDPWPAGDGEGPDPFDSPLMPPASSAVPVAGLPLGTGGPSAPGGGIIVPPPSGGIFIPLPVAPPPGGGEEGEGDSGVVDPESPLPPVPPAPPPPPPVSAIPEPGTWAMIILGLFGIGFAMRRSNASRRQRLQPSVL